MVKLLINRSPVVGAWGGGNQFVRAFYDCAKDNGVQLVSKLSDDPGVIFIFHPFSEDGSVTFEEAISYKRTHPETKLVIRANECDARKNTQGVDDVWKEMGHHSDHTFFVSKWMQDYYEQRGWDCPSNEVLINGIDRERFKNQKKLSVSTGKTNIVCAHWSDNSLKGQDIYEFLDEFVGHHADFTFTFIGRTKAKLQHSFKEEPLDPAELAKELTKYDVCVNGSRFDPGPNAVIESIAAQLPTYVHIDGGGAVEFAGPNHAFKTTKELESILLSKNFSMNPDIFRDWGFVMSKVFARIKSL